MVLHENDIENIINKWKGKLQKYREKKTTLTECKFLIACINDLENLLKRKKEEEEQASIYYNEIELKEMAQFMEENEADYWISSLEGQERNYI